MRADIPVVESTRPPVAVPEDMERLLQENDDIIAMGDVSPAQVVSSADGWRPLLWSFLAATSITVRHLLSMIRRLIASLAICLLLSRGLCRPNIRNIPCAGVVVVFYAQSIICRSRCGNPTPFNASLLKCQKGIIMGFSTTASMNLVSIVGILHQPISDVD